MTKIIEIPKTEVLTPDDLVQFFAGVKGMSDRVQALESQLATTSQRLQKLEGPKPVDPPPAPTGQYKLKMDVNFNGGVSADQVYMQATNLARDGKMYDRYQVVALPWDQAKKGIKFNIIPGDRWNGGAPYPRAEFMIAQGQNDILFNRRYYFESNLVFSGFVENPKEMLAPMQIHHDGNTTIPIALNLTGGQFKLVIRKTPSSPTWYTILDKIEAGRKYKLGLEVLGDKSSSGFVRVFIDGVLKCEHKGQVGYADSLRLGYFKHGLYDWGNTVPDGLEMISDGVRWYEAV